ncbi:hypothetical protein HY504_01390 [Candidatus Wolfebacteria bacterium]|nr:hypothetical protein [Candidatus Wolfebacteria bacterium]
MRNLLTRISIFFLAIVIVIAIVFLALNVGRTPDPRPVLWGVNFSQKFAVELGLDWQKTYIAILDDLGARRIKLASYWDLVEPAKDSFSFDDFDWQVREAEKRSAELTLVIGMKTPRWPECHIPKWAKNMSTEERQKEILALLKAIVSRYKPSLSVIRWQVENEPFFSFGECPDSDSSFLRKEIEAVKAIDPSRPVLVSDTGEMSLWITAARYGDIVGSTLYRRVWFKEIQKFVSFPLTPLYYSRRAALVKYLYGKDVINVELQAEPWSPLGSPLLISRDEEERTMSIDQLRENIDFARRTGMKEAYFWGAEWWYHEKQNGRPEFWEEGRKTVQEE